jgi:hypothetical protein
MNVDQERDRCKVPELNPAKLRRVAFCVDVEIAGTARRSESDDEKKQPKRNKKSDSKSTEKNGSVSTEPPVTSGEPSSNPAEGENGEASKSAAQPKELSRRQEKKKKSEEERKERKEKKRRLAEESGSVPLQLNGGRSSIRPHRGQDQPTTDPVRIYRRCCQLRETGVLKKLVEQISSPSSVLAESPGTVAVLDLTDFWMTLPDIITFSDWLAIVPKLRVD